MKRIVESYMCKWRKIQHLCQQYMAPRVSVVTNFPSGRNSEEAGNNVQRVHCKRTRTLEVLVEVHQAPQFQYHEAAAFLSKKPKWANGVSNSTSEKSQSALFGDYVDALSGVTPPFRAIYASGSGGIKDMAVVTDDVEKK